jgi:hypothetical protein
MAMRGGFGFVEFMCGTRPQTFHVHHQEEDQQANRAKAAVSISLWSPGQEPQNAS